MTKSRLLPLTLVLSFALCGCTTVQTHSFEGASVVSETGNRGQSRMQNNNIQILYSEPRRDFESLGTFSVRKYKPGFSDPTVSDAIPELREAAGRLGADAVIIRRTTSHETRFTTIEGEAIRWM